MATALEQWVDDAARKTRPKQVVWCDGSEGETEQMVEKLVEACQYLDQRRLAGAVLPGQAVHLAGPDGEFDIHQDLDGPEGLAQ